MTSSQRRSAPRTAPNASRQRSAKPIIGAWERRGAIAVVVEAGLLVLGAGGLLVAWISGRVSSGGMAAFLGVASLLAAGGLVVVARALWRGARWPRGATVAWQVLQLAVARGLLFPATWPWVVPPGVRFGVVIALVGLVAVALAGVITAALRTQREMRR